MTSNARLAVTMTASIAAAAAAVPAVAGGAKVPLGPDVVAAPVAAPGGKVGYVTRRAGRGTLVEARERAGGRTLRVARLPGEYAVPAVAYDGSASGLSADGRTLVLINPRRRFPRVSTTFAVLDGKPLRLRRVLRLKGDFSFDALSPDGSQMYLINYLSPRDPTRYRVRVYDLRASRLLPKPVVDPSEPPDEMSGQPITRATSPDGRWAYTLYDGTEHPFIHALDTERRTAACIDLDDLTTEDASDARLVLPGGTLRVEGTAAPLALVDTRTFAVRDPAAKAPPVRRVASSGDDDGGGVPWFVAFIALLPLAGLAVVARRRRHASSA